MNGLAIHLLSVAVGLLVAVVQTGLIPAVNKALVAALENPAGTTIARIAWLVVLFFTVKVAVHAGMLASRILHVHLGGLRVEARKKAIIRALSLSPVFADLDSAQLSRLAENADATSVPASGFLFRKGDAGDSLFVIASGQVEINGTHYGPGHAFGEIALFGGLRRSADVRAVADSQFLVLRRDDVLSACRENPEIPLRLLSSLSRIAARA